MGALGFLIALIGAPIIRLVMNTLISQGDSEMPVTLLNSMQGLVGALARQILKPVVIEGLIFLLLGSGMYGFDVYLKKKGYV